MSSDDLSQKSDDELREIMRSSIGNQYVPSSIYHKARQELEFRSSKNSGQNLSDFELTVLGEIEHEPVRVPTFKLEFQSLKKLKERFPDSQHKDLDTALEKLKRTAHIVEVSETLPNGAHYSGYKLTPTGRNYLRRTPSAPSNDSLSKTARAVMVSLKNSAMGTDAHGKFITKDILNHQFSDKRMPLVEDALSELLSLDYIEEVEDSESVYRMTPYGNDYMSHGTSNTIFSNISNSNIANQSPGSKQTIKLSDLSVDLQNKIQEFDNAANKKDPNGMKKAFGYIADKAVDVAIALSTGALIR